MKNCLLVSMLLLMQGVSAQGQNEPIVNQPSFGFSLPRVEGTLSYAISGSEAAMTGFGTSGVAYMTSLSGDLAYLSSSVSDPFSLVYSGGYMYFDEPGYPSNTTFQNLAASQVVTTKNWIFTVEDGFSYLPDSPTMGLSGIPGLGDISVTPVQNGLEPTRSIFSNYATQVGNGLTGQVTRTISGNLSMVGSGSWQILDFTSGENINSTEEMGTLGPLYRINANSSVSADVIYTYTTDSIQGLVLPFTTEAISVQYQRQVTPLLSFTVAGGPQRTYATGPAEALFPAQISMVGSAGLVYQRKMTSASLFFARGTNAGSGMVFGAMTDSVTGTLTRQFNREWQGALTGSWAKSTALAQVEGYSLDYDSTAAGAQISRSLGKDWSAYFSYSAVDQTSTGQGVGQAAFSGLEQTYAVGVTYSPAAHHFGQQ